MRTVKPLSVFYNTILNDNYLANHFVVPEKINSNRSILGLCLTLKVHYFLVTQRLPVRVWMRMNPAVRRIFETAIRFCRFSTTPVNGPALNN